MYGNRQTQQTAAHQLCLRGLISHATGVRSGGTRPRIWLVVSLRLWFLFVSVRYKEDGILLLLWPGFAPFELARSSSVSGILDLRSRDIIYMTGPDLGFGNGSGRISYVVKKDGQQSEYMRVPWWRASVLFKESQGGVFLSTIAAHRAYSDDEMPFNSSPHNLSSHPRATSETLWPQDHLITLLPVRKHLLRYSTFSPECWLNRFSVVATQDGITTRLYCRYP